MSSTYLCRVGIGVRKGLCEFTTGSTCASCWYWEIVAD